MGVELWLLLLVSFATVTVMIAFFVLIFLYLSTNPYPDIDRELTERVFYDPMNSEYVRFPFGLTHRPEVELSVIVPAYNEAQRLPTMMEEALAYLTSRMASQPKFTFEIIVVDDGSVDSTYQVAISYSSKYTSNVVRVLKLTRNRGKGAAVRIGMLSARGKFLLFADADGATRFRDIEKLEKQMAFMIASKWDGRMAVICGSRAHLQAEATAKRNPLRNLLMYGFHFAVWLLCVRGLRDTQCGFKLFSRRAARLLFMNQHVERWAFDVDLLYLARHLSVEICEVPVTWHEVNGSKIIPLFSWMQMAKDLLLIRLRYGLGAWKIEQSHHLE
ncbi:Dolichyl-phosphate beta-glucosyltransferase [Echinococcus granulosus]|uniref:Dolichyl-phosphate beta-glucosyltransferase n=1 Tax=Echinococcus granulosus TaxID=6210 RepID=U6J2L8_ECHGR|nr:Dolichyl-phosphate beta-glucosyltransferase [Echinococcus granulosus]EUB63767.1 Dolichyl-phosphate beta-glucosyltransferase [Echinococcus granulosus]CDS15930.1 dolichyl phosphate beta glucosyltransferase [Echinococcus granulosus]